MISAVTSLLKSRLMFQCFTASMETDRARELGKTIKSAMVDSSHSGKAVPNVEADATHTADVQSNVHQPSQRVE
eukprot:m.202309 g.202309  ORF g.202309 m.202309 type:complete len:74 (+) comp39609_c0_seq5:1050-1271(+)